MSIQVDPDIDLIDFNTELPCLQSSQVLPSIKILPIKTKIKKRPKIISSEDIIKFKELYPNGKLCPKCKLLLTHEYWYPSGIFKKGCYCIPCMKEYKKNKSEEIDMIDL
jgi:hypothetical protein